MLKQVELLILYIFCPNGDLHSMMSSWSVCLRYFAPEQDFNSYYPDCDEFGNILIVPRGRFKMIQMNP